MRSSYVSAFGSLNVSHGVKLPKGMLNAWKSANGELVSGAFDTGVSTATLLPFALLLPPVAMAGDLFESWMKRRMGVKDASGLLPGHGGFLDRLDSVVAVFPVLYLFLQVRVL